MSESPPLPAAMGTVTTEKPANMIAEKPPTQINSSQHSVSAPAQRDPKAQEFKPGCGLALFSTELGTRAKRALEGQPRPPVIVRSDGVKGVVDAARIWQLRFKVQCLCIFPGQGWKVNDLWDDVDIQLDTPSFCQQMLTFISRDTWHAARRFAQDWMRVYPERLSIVGSDMAELHTTGDPFEMVDRIYNEGERGAFPRTFLWHVAHMMRPAVLEMDLGHTAAATRNKNPPYALQREEPKTALQVVSGNSQPTQPQAVEAAASPGRKKNRKITRSRPVKLTDVTASSSTTEPTSVKSAPLPTVAPLPVPQRHQVRVSSHELQRPGSQHVEPIASAVDISIGHTAISPRLPPQNLMVQKGPPRHMASAAFLQPGPSHGWAENNYHPGPGQYPPRQTSGGMPQLPVPQIMVPDMAMGQHIVPTGYVAPYAHGPPMMPTNMVPIPHFNTTMVPPGMILHPTAMMPNPHMGPVYATQPHTVRGVSMGDMTNNGYYTNGMAPQNFNNQVSSIRRSSAHNANSTLFDPYNGTNSNFREAKAFNKGKKPSYNEATLPSNRPRNISNSGPHPTYPTYKHERAPTQPYSGGRFNGARRRENSEDDPAITGNRLTGCHEDWIGPENVTVNELFVGYLPLDVAPAELHKMFEQQLSITPADVSIRTPKKYEGSIQHDRCHAFIALASIADAKKVMGMRDRNFRLRDNGHTVSVSVPRRFFQLSSSESLRRGSSSSGSYNVLPQPGPSGEREGPKTIRSSTRDENRVLEQRHASETPVKPVYSPQDARSGLHQKSEARLNVNNDGFVEASQGRKPKSKQNSPVKKQQIRRAAPTPNTPSGKGTKAADTKTDESAAVANAVVVNADIDESTLDQARGDKISAIPADTKHATVKKPTTLSTIAFPVDEGCLGSLESSDIHLGAGDVSKGSGEIETRAIVQSDSTPAADTPLELPVTAAVVRQSTEAVPTEAEQPTRAMAASSPQSPKHNEVNNDVTREVSHGTALVPQTNPTPAIPDTGPPEKPTATEKEKEFSKANPPTTYSAELTQPAAVMTASQVTGSTDNDDAAATLGDTAHDVGTVSTTKSAKLSTAEVSAKAGVQQVSSLHPYAKPNKTHQKKAKDALRKQQKKEQVEKAEKAKAEKAKAEKVKAEKTKPSAMTKEEPLLEDDTAKSQSSLVAPVLPGTSSNETSNHAAERFNPIKIQDGKLNAEVNIAAVASDSMHGSEHCSKAILPPSPPTERISADNSTTVFNEARECQAQTEKIPTMASEDPIVQSKMKESQDSPIDPVEASDPSKPVSAEPATPTPKKKSKKKSKKKKDAPVGEDNEQGEGDANGKLHSNTRETNSITPKAINIPGSPNHSTRLVSLGVSAAALATEVRASSITKLPSNSSPASCLHPSSAQRLVNPNEDQLVLAVPQQIIPHFEQSEHSQTFHQQAPATTHRPSSLSEFPEPALDTPPSTNPSDNHRDTVLSLTPSKNIATADRQSASSPSAYIPTSDILQTDVTKVASSPVDTPAAEALPKKKKKNKKKNKKKSTTDAADGSAPEKSSSSPQNTGACVFSYQKPIAAVNPASGIEDPLMAAAAAAIRDQRNNEIRRAIAGNVKVFITTNSNASLGDVQAEYAAAGAKPSSTPYQLAEGQLVEDLRPRNLLPQSIQDYVRELPSHMQEKEKSKKSE